MGGEGTEAEAKQTEVATAVFLLLVYLMTLSVSQAVQCQMIG
jgi:hypothetical protein